MITELAIIIVNWNGRDFLPACLLSIAANPPGVPYEVVVVDNASSDGSMEWLRSNEAKEIFPPGKFNVIESLENLGYGRANNLGIEQTTTPFVLVLNPDTTVGKNALDHLIQAAECDEKIGMSVPKVVGDDGSVKASVSTFPGALRVIVEGLELYRIVPGKIRGEWLLAQHWTYDRTRDVPMASGCAMMLKRTAINEVGAFNPEIFMYGEDIELCYRMNSGGWRIVFEPEAEITHIGAQSSAQVWSHLQTSVKEEEAALAFQERCFSSFAVAKNTLARLFVLAGRYIIRVLRRKDTLFFDKMIPLQFRAFRRAIYRIFSFS